MRAGDEADMKTFKTAGLIASVALLAAGAVIAEEKKVITKTEIKPAEGISAATGTEVGIADRDGITLAGSAVLVTRNGVSERLIKAIELENGTQVTPEGTLMLKTGEKIPMRVGQLLTFNGELIDLNREKAGNASQPKTLNTDATVAGEKTTVTTVTERGTTAVSEKAGEKADEEVKRRENNEVK